MRKKLVILTGAGMSQESGLRTFRDMGGLWEEYDITEVATPEAWRRNPRGAGARVFGSAWRVRPWTMPFH